MNIQPNISDIFFNSVHVLFKKFFHIVCFRGRRGRDRMVVGFTTTYAISACYHRSCDFEPRPW